MQTIFLRIRIAQGITYIYESISISNGHHVFTRRNDIEAFCLDENSFNKNLIKHFYVKLSHPKNLTDKQIKEIKDSIKFI